MDRVGGAEEGVDEDADGEGRKRWTREEGRWVRMSMRYDRCG